MLNFSENLYFRFLVGGLCSHNTFLTRTDIFFHNSTRASTAICKKENSEGEISVKSAFSFLGNVVRETFPVKVLRLWNEK